MRPIAVFDTNIILSAIRSKGKPWQSVELARAGRVEGIICWELVEELSEKLEVKFKFSPEETDKTVADLMTFLRDVSIPGTLRAVPADPDDDKVLECAVVGGATHVVTGDRRHLLPLGNFKGIDIVTAADFLALVAQP